MANKFNFTLFIELLTNCNTDMFTQDNTQANLC